MAVKPRPMFMIAEDLKDGKFDYKNHIFPCYKSAKKAADRREGCFKVFQYTELKQVESTHDMYSLEKLALEVREVIYEIYPDYYEKYTGEMLHSPEYVFDIAALICKEQEESE